MFTVYYDDQTGDLGSIQFTDRWWAAETALKVHSLALVVDFLMPVLAEMGVDVERVIHPRRRVAHDIH